jgi:hypothetical protein
MDLDRCLASSDSVGYLFVQETGNDPWQHFLESFGGKAEGRTPLKDHPGQGAGYLS